MNKDLSNLSENRRSPPAVSDKQKGSMPSSAMEEAAVQIDIDIKQAESASPPIDADFLKKEKKTAEAVVQDAEADAVDNKTVKDDLQDATDGSQVAMFDQDKMINIDDSQAQ